MSGATVLAVIHGSRGGTFVRLALPARGGECHARATRRADSWVYDTIVRAATGYPVADEDVAYELGFRELRAFDAWLEAALLAAVGS